MSMRSWDSESMTSYGVMPSSRRGTFATSMTRPVPARAADSALEAVRPAAPRSWMPVIQSAWLWARSRQASMSIFSRNGLPTCTAGRSSSKRACGSVREARPEAPWMPSRPVSAPTSMRTLPTPSAFALASLSIGRDADAHGVDERVRGVGVLEDDLAADGGDAEAVAVAADAGDDAAEEVAVARASSQRPEAEGVEEGDRARAHREDVADDAADAGGRALVGLDGGGVVVGLDLHDDAHAVADVDCAGVLGAAAGEDVGALGGKQAEEGLRVLVAAVLAPERAEQAELDLVGLAAEALDDEVVFVAAESDGVEDFLVYGHVFRIRGA